MLPKKNRISRVLFARIHKNRVFFNSPHISLTITRITSTPLKFSFVVSKKVAKSAVERNHLRRRGYSALRILLESPVNRVSSGVVGAFFFKKGAERLRFSEMKDEIGFLLKKAKII